MNNSEEIILCMKSSAERGKKIVDAAEQTIIHLGYKYNVPDPFGIDRVFYIGNYKGKEIRRDFDRQELSDLVLQDGIAKVLYGIPKFEGYYKRSRIQHNPNMELYTSISRMLSAFGISSSLGLKNYGHIRMKYYKDPDDYWKSPRDKCIELSIEIESRRRPFIELLRTFHPLEIITVGAFLPFTDISNDVKESYRDRLFKENRYRDRLFREEFLKRYEKNLSQID